MPIATNLARMPAIKLCDVVTWSGNIMWQIKNILSPLPQSLWPPNVAGW